MTAFDLKTSVELPHHGGPHPRAHGALLTRRWPDAGPRTQREPLWGRGRWQTCRSLGPVSLLILFPGPLTRSLLPSTLYWPLPIKRVDAYFEAPNSRVLNVSTKNINISINTAVCRGGRPLRGVVTHSPRPTERRLAGRSLDRNITNTLSVLGVAWSRRMRRHTRSCPYGAGPGGGEGR